MHILITPRGVVAQTADILMTPLMYAVSGTLRESPQRTHAWNCRDLKPEEKEGLNPDLMVYKQGIPTRMQKNRGIFFHMPIVGGWRNYVTITPSNPEEGWHVGWYSPHIAGISRIRLTTPARLLVGPKDISFYGVSATGVQKAVEEMGIGKIGDNGPYKNYPLL